MPIHNITNAEGKCIGKLETRMDGSAELRDARGLLRAVYDPKSNQTRDKEGYVIGEGNILEQLK